ncbi:hypothetical protein V1477_000206 [Vespula maculifrons]|uniref:Uncharacterized protein n=1 Tax=Vespula maculifrons TaxID=7453 RepID=A0ABD2D0Y2_VESMC
MVQLNKLNNRKSMERYVYDRENNESKLLLILNNIIVHLVFPMCSKFQITMNNSIKLKIMQGADRLLALSQIQHGARWNRPINGMSARRHVTRNCCICEH